MILSTDTMDFARFLVRAKIATYASGTDELAVTPVLPHSHQLEYIEENLHYRDIYYGGLHFIGLETIFLNSSYYVFPKTYNRKSH